MFALNEFPEFHESDLDQNFSIARGSTPSTGDSNLLKSKMLAMFSTISSAYILCIALPLMKILNSSAGRIASCEWPTNEERVLMSNSLQSFTLLFAVTLFCTIVTLLYAVACLWNLPQTQGFPLIAAAITIVSAEIGAVVKFGSFLLSVKSVLCSGEDGPSLHGGFRCGRCIYRDYLDLDKAARGSLKRQETALLLVLTGLLLRTLHEFLSSLSWIGSFGTFFLTFIGGIFAIVLHVFYADAGMGDAQKYLTGILTTWMHWFLVLLILVCALGRWQTNCARGHNTRKPRVINHPPTIRYPLLPPVE